MQEAIPPLGAAAPSAARPPPPPPLLGSDPASASPSLKLTDIGALATAPVIPVMPNFFSSPESAQSTAASKQRKVKQAWTAIQQRDIAEIRDGYTTTISIFVRAVRIMLLWTILYFVDRAFQAMYIEEVMTKDGNEDVSVMDLKPRLWSMIIVTLAVEAVLLLALFLVFLAIKKRFKRPGNTFVIDDALIRGLVRQYLSTIALVAPLGILLGYAMQSCKELRYRDDGLRGIRALAVMLLVVSGIIVAAVP